MELKWAGERDVVTVTPTRRAKIIATVGPACWSPERLEQMLQAGLDVIRLNMSHGTHDEHAVVVSNVRRLARAMDRAVAILLDLQGPKIRTGPLAAGSVVLVAGARFTLTTQEAPGDARCVSTTYVDLPSDVKAGDTILISDGLLAMRVVSTTRTEVHCQVVSGGVLGQHQGINLPGVAVSTAAVTPKDESDLAFGIAQGVDYIALSFVRQPTDVQRARDLMAAHGAAIPLIAKLEKPEALDHLDAILEVADGLMVARGDLGVEMPLERVPLIQKEAIRRSNKAGKVVITATQMLESMIEHPRPTRAEASDVANAVLDDTDAVMLSGETAMGAYPVETVEMMARIISAAEGGPRRPVDHLDHMRGGAPALGHAAAVLASETAVRAIVVFTQSGYSARLVAKERPGVPLFAFTEDESVYNQLALWWGVTPLLGRFRPTTDEQLIALQEVLVAGGHAERGETVVIMGSLPVMERARTNFLKLHRIE